MKITMNGYSVEGTPNEINELLSLQNLKSNLGGSKIMGGSIQSGTITTKSNIDCSKQEWILPRAEGKIAETVTTEWNEALKNKNQI